METSAILWVLLAAVMHASWNAMVKGAHDKTIILAWVALGHALPGMAIAVYFPLPAMESWPYLGAGVVIRWGYYWLLNVSYRLGDLSLVYPLARGIAPAIIALGATVWLGEHLSGAAWAGVVLICLGGISLGAPFLRCGVSSGVILAAMATAVCVATYSLVDGVGIRLSGTVMGYVGWLLALEVLIFLYVAMVFPSRLLASRRFVLWGGLAGGAMAGAAYGVVLAIQANFPLGLVAALRETSMLVAAMIGVWKFGERPIGYRLVAAGIMAIGVACIAVG